MISRWFHPLPVIAAGTRRLQALQPNRPLRGLTRLANWLDRWLPPHEGVIRLSDGVRLLLDSRQPAERWLLFAGDYQPALTRLLRRYAPVGGYCVDVGANLGFYTVKLARWVGSHGRVAAFEANPAMAERIAHHIGLNGFSHVDVVAKAIHCRSECIAFYIASAPGKSSVQPDHVPHPVKTLEVEAITLDDYIGLHRWQRLDLVKIDIEGNDCNALLGAQKTLAYFRPVVVFEYWYNTPTEVARATFELLAELGYSLHRLHPNGRQTLFDWQQPPVNRMHDDILALSR